MGIAPSIDELLDDTAFDDCEHFSSGLRAFPPMEPNFRAFLCQRSTVRSILHRPNQTVV
jgi:hypothetical protein